MLPVGMLCSSCSSTPQTRIERNPELFRSLSPTHQDMVSKGQIDLGMSKPAVYLAMGNPDNKTSGVQHGKSFERWYYNVMIPVYRHDLSPYYGYGYGRRGYHGGYYGLGYSPSVHYVTKRGASVEFRNDAVIGWASAKRSR